MRNTILFILSCFVLTATTLQADAASEITKVLQETLLPSVQEAGFNGNIALKQYKVMDNRIVDFIMETELESSASDEEAFWAALVYHDASLGDKLTNAPSRFEKYEVLLSLKVQMTTPVPASSKEEFEEMLKKAIADNGIDLSSIKSQVIEWEAGTDGNGGKFYALIEFNEPESSDTVLFDMSAEAKNVLIHIGFNIKKPLPDEQALIDFIAKIEQRDPETVAMLQAYSQIFAGTLKLGLAHTQSLLENSP